MRTTVPAGEVVRNWRRARRMSPGQLGELIGRSEGHIKKIENGQRPVVLELAVPLARMMGVSLEALLPPEQVALIETAAVMMDSRRCFSDPCYSPIRHP